MYKLKSVPEDFIVNERINIDYNPEGNYRIYLMTKKDFSTMKAIELISQRLKLKHRLIGFAGNKDKSAVTKQYISIPKSYELPGMLSEKIVFQSMGFSNKPISLGDLEGNDFVIIARNLLHTNIRDFRIMPNYFDDQRFGMNNVAVGRLLIKRKFSDALDVILSSSDDYVMKKISKSLENFKNDNIGALRKMPLKLLKFYVHAYQSWIFNEGLSNYLSENEDNYVEQYSLGKLLIPKKEMPQIKIPIIGFSTSDLKYIKQMADSEQIKPRDFIFREIPELSSEGGERDAFCDIESLSYRISDDEMNPGNKKSEFRFFLRKGSYATMAIRTIFAGLR